MTEQGKASTRVFANTALVRCISEFLSPVEMLEYGTVNGSFRAALVKIPDGTWREMSSEICKCITGLNWTFPAVPPDTSLVWRVIFASRLRAFLQYYKRKDQARLTNVA